MNHAKALYGVFYRLPPTVKAFLARRWFDLVSACDKDADIRFMNLGWSALEPTREPVELADSDEPDRYAIQLYHHLVRDIDLEALDVLEVGCGRGGGASYLMRYCCPRSLVGLDISPNAIDFCNRFYSIEGLSFRRGAAESLALEEHSFDVVINVESSHVYSDMARFLAGVRRTLRPGGYFLFADARFKHQMPALREYLRNSGLTLLREENISTNVWSALELDSDRKTMLIEQRVPRLLRRLFHEFASTRQSLNTAYAHLPSGAVEYWCFTLRKP
jgi:SAM-dependent methyltransferase